MKTIVVIGAGMGGLTAAIRLAQAGFDVQILEARGKSGGLASGVQFHNLCFDAGPYILLDRPGLEWAFARIGLDADRELRLRRIEEIYEVEGQDGSRVRFCSDRKRTAAGFEAAWPGSGRRYLDFVARMERIAGALRPMLQVSRPRALGLLRTGAWMHAPFLMKSLGAVLRESQLPQAVIEAMAIWTHVAGQTKDEAPSPLAFVPALMHSVGAFYPAGGIRRIPSLLEQIAISAGVKIRYSTKVKHVRLRSGKVTGVETSANEFIHTDVVVSNAAALSTYLELATIDSGAERFARLPLQSPGVCAYLAVRGSTVSPYLRFKLPGGNERCRLLICPAVMNEPPTDGWHTARLLAPMAYDDAERGGDAGQREYLDRLLQETWWRNDLGEIRVLHKRSASEWGAEYNLYANSMNPVMTARFMRAGRFAHRSPYGEGLYLAGSSTHPGQWVSFCAISGILAADCVIEDLG